MAHPLSQKIKDILVQMAVDDKIPMDFNGFPAEVFDNIFVNVDSDIAINLLKEPSSPVINRLNAALGQSLKDCKELNRELIEALQAIKARIEGEWDNPALVKQGLLMPDSEDDILTYARQALAKANTINKHYTDVKNCPVCESSRIEINENDVKDFGVDTDMRRCTNCLSEFTRDGEITLDMSKIK